MLAYILIYMLIGMLTATQWEKKHKLLKNVTSIGSLLGNIFGFLLTAAIWPIIVIMLIK